MHLSLQQSQGTKVDSLDMIYLICIYIVYSVMKYSSSFSCWTRFGTQQVHEYCVQKTMSSIDHPPCKKVVFSGWQPIR